MQQGAGGGHRHVVGLLAKRVDQAEADGVVVAPNVAAVDHAREQGGVLGDAVLLDRGEVLVLAFVEVEADAVEAQQVHGLVHVGDVAEVRVEQHLDLVFASGQDLRVQALEEGDVAVLLVKHEVRLVELQPLGAECGEALDHFRVDGGDRVHQALVVGELLGLRVAGELEEGVGADQHRLGEDAPGLCLVELVERLGAVEADLGALLDFRNDVVVVGGEPLLHRQGSHVALVALIAAAHGEQRLLGVREGESLVTLRDDIEQDRGVQHLVIVAEVVAGDEIDAGLCLQLPVLRAKFLGSAAHLVE